MKLVKEKGIDGLIIPDLPIEEDEEVRQLAEAADVHLISTCSSDLQGSCRADIGQSSWLRLLCIFARRNRRAC